MGAVRSSLVLNDGMSPALRRINNAMSLVLNNFEAVQRASGKSMNTANIAAARQEIGRANAALDQMEQNYRDCNNQQANLNRNISTGTSKANGLMNKLKGVVATYLGMKTLSGLIGLSDTMTSNAARLELIVDDGGSVAELQKKIFASAQSARASYTDTMATVSKLGILAGKAFSDNNQIIKFQELVNKNFVIGGASAQEQSSAMYQLTQAMAAGKLQGDEYRTITESAPLLAKSIEDYMTRVRGLSGTMKDWASQGLLTANVIKAAVFNSADEVEARFNKMPKTWAQLWIDMKNRATFALDPVLKKLNALANSENVQKTITGLINNFVVLATVVGGVFDVICNIYNFMAENWGWIGPIIMGVVTAMLLYKAATLIAAGVIGIMSIAQTIHAGTTVAEALATGGATAAQSAFNAALWACPITWIIALIIALIVVFVIFTEQIVGAIWWLGALFKNIGLWIANCGLAAWQVIKNVGLWFANLGLSIWAIIKNMGAWFGNLGMGIWEVMKACVENIKAAFANGWINIQIGFNSFIETILKGVRQVIEWLNMIPGVNINTQGISDSIQGYADKKAALEASKHEYQDLGKAWEKGNSTFEYASVSDAYNTYDYGSVGDAFGTFDTFQSGWGSDAYSAGAEVGKGIKTWMSDNLSVDGILGKLGVDTGGSTDPLGYGDTLSDIAGDTSSLSDNSKKTTEELAYLRDIAEKEAINRFTTAEVKIDMTGMTNRIDSDMDIDGVVNKLTEEFVDALSTAAEGVHDDEL